MLNLKPDDATRSLAPGGEPLVARRGAALARRRPDVLVPQPQQLLVAVLRDLARDI